MDSLDDAVQISPKKLSEEKIDDIKQQYAKTIIDNSRCFADNVIKRLVAHTLNLDVDELFDECLDTRGAINIEDKRDSKNIKGYTLSLDIVHKDYMLDLGTFHGNPEIKKRMIFLLEMVKLAYCPVKDHMKVWASENNTTFNYVLQLANNTTQFIDKDSENRIGIILTPVPLKTS